jgi:hypothetical protein|tara:strand:- start:12027 stop:13541 length:1515 start_codon:yes stop_codon:yes gene_type:complete
MEKIAEQFSQLFKGSERAHGYFEIKKDRNDGKKQGKAVTIKTSGPTVQFWQKHLQGEYGLGVIPINDDNQCHWGCIDVDVYPLDIAELVDKIEEQKLPLVVCRSKSGGAHILLFVAEPVEAGEMQDKLREIAAGLGFGGLEIFPKQRQVLADRGDIGSWLNMPYFGGEDSTRYGFSAKGESLTIEQFLAFAVERQLPTAEDLYNIEISAIVDDLEFGPPCLKILLKQGFPEGTRNNGLFNVAVYLQKAHPEAWEDKLEDYNRKYFKPPLPANEVSAIIQQHKKKDYNYKCGDEPIKSYCNSTKCRTCKFGVGAGHDAPLFSSLAKLNTDPPLWFMSVNDKRLELSTEQLQNQIRFQRVCMETLNIMPPKMKEQTWQGLVQQLLENGLEIIDVSEDASIQGQFNELLESFCTDIAQASTREEMLLGKPWTNENKTHFRIRDLMDYLQRHRFMDMKTNQVAAKLKDMGAEHIFFNIRGRGVNAWSIPAFISEDVDIDLPNMKQDPF